MKDGWKAFVDGHKALDDAYCPHYAFEKLIGSRVRCQFVGLLNDSPHEEIVQNCEDQF